MDEKTKQAICDTVYKAQKGHYTIPRLTKELCPELSIEEAYEVQRALIDTCLNAGDGVLGLKMGLTSKAKLEQMHVKDPVYGYLLASMAVENGGEAAMASYIHPKVEPEIGLILSKALYGKNLSRDAVLEAVEWVFPAIEIIDSRYENFEFTVPDVICDNTSAAGAVFGEKQRYGGEDLGKLKAVIALNGTAAASGYGSDVLGHPADSVAALAGMLEAKGEGVPAGMPILTGGITAAASVKAGDEAVAFVEGLTGRACVRFVG